VARTNRKKELTDQLVIRVDKRLHEALREDAARNGRTIAQSVRFHLNNIVGQPD
jgi:predicted HicB family RNase H-like nuclease